MIPWESCVLWLGYPLQNGVWPDVSKHDNDGAIIGARWEEDSVDFDGIDDRVTCEHNSLFNFERTDPFTLEVLIRIHTGDIAHSVMGTMMVAAPNRGYEVLIRKTDRLIVIFMRHDNSPSLATIVRNVEGVPVNKWCHIVWTNQGVDGSASDQTLYMNGKVSNKVTVLDTLGANTIQTSEPFIVGMRGGVSFPTDADIALVRGYNIELTSEQVREAYEQCYRLV